MRVESVPWFMHPQNPQEGPVPQFLTEEGGEPFTLAEFEEVNQDAPLEPEDMAGIRALQVGESIQLGGGAMAVTTIRRVI